MAATREAKNDQSVYPNIERYLERSDRVPPATLFAPTREKLAAVSGPKAASAKKAMIAIDHAEAVINELIALGEKLENEARGARKFRR